MSPTYQISVISAGTAVTSIALWPVRPSEPCQLGSYAYQRNRLVAWTSNADSTGGARRHRPTSHPQNPCRGDRQDRASLGHTGVRPAELPDQCCAESAGGEVVAPARVIDARQKWLLRYRDGELDGSRLCSDIPVKMRPPTPRPAKSPPCSRQSFRSYPPLQLWRMPRSKRSATGVGSGGGVNTGIETSVSQIPFPIKGEDQGEDNLHYRPHQPAVHQHRRTRDVARPRRRQERYKVR